MTTLGARNQHRNGLMALVDGRFAEAAECFRTAMELERNTSDAGKCTARSLSYYGVAMALSDRPTPDAIRACEMAARADRWDPDLRLIKFGQALHFVQAAIVICFLLRRHVRGRR